MRVGVGGIDLTLVSHRGGERQRLAARARTKVEDLHAGLGFRHERRELRALVLQLDMAFDVSRIGRERRRAAVGAHGDAHADGREGRRLGLEMGERAERLVACGLEDVHAEINGRALSQRPALLGRGRAEARLELGVEPFGEIPRHMRGRVRQVGGCEPRTFVFRELRRSVALACEKRGDRIDTEVVRLSERPQEFGARTNSPMIQADELLRRKAS